MMLPLLLTASGNRSGTYFSRMVSWPGKEAGGVNQLALRISRLRGERRNSRSTHNALEILSLNCCPRCPCDILDLQVASPAAALDKARSGLDDQATAAEGVGARHVHVSISHDQGWAVAFAIATAQPLERTSDSATQEQIEENQ